MTPQFLKDELPYSVLINSYVLLHRPIARERSMSRSLFLGVMWDVKPINIDLLDDLEVDQISERLGNTIRNLPIHSVVDVRLDSYPCNKVEAWEAARQDMTGEHLDWQRAHIRQGMTYISGGSQNRLRQNQITVGLRVPISPNKPTGFYDYMRMAAFWRSKKTQKYFDSVFSQELQEEVHQFSVIEQTLCSAMSEMGLTPVKLTDEELGARISRQLNPDTTTFTPEKGVPIRDVLVSCDTSLDSDGCTLSNRQGFVLVPTRGIYSTCPGILSSARSPEGTNTAMNISGIVSDKPYSISVVTTVPDRRKTISSLQSRTRMAWAQRKGASGETRSDVDAQSEEISDLLRDITSGTTDILPTGVRIIVWDDVGHDDVPNAVVSHMSLHGLHFQIERNVGNTLFLQSLSLGTDVEYPRDETLGGMPSILSIHTANLLPLWGCYRGPGTTSAEGTLFLNRLGDPVLFDPFDGAGSPHGIVIGQTRSGKSAAVNTILHQILPTGAIAFILDRYGSYEQLCRIHDGKHYAMSIDNPICLGLMDGPLDAAHRATIHAALSEMCTGSGVGNALDAEESALLSVLVQAWVESLTPSSERNLSGFVSSFGELSQEIEGGSISGLCDKLRLLLMPYYGSGDYAAFIDGPNELDLDQQHLVSIDIAGLRESKEIESVLVAMLFLRFTAVVQNPDLIHTPKFMIADEVAFLLESPATGRFFATLARALARFKCSLITVSQLLSDFDSDLGQKIASLSGFRMLFRLSHMENEVMIKHGLSAKARELIRASTRSDTHATAVLTTKTGESGVIRILAPPEFMTQIGQDESHINKREAMECPTSSS